MGQGRNAGLDKVYCCTIPFLSATQQHTAAVLKGKPEKSIYVEGRTGESFDIMLKQFRDGGTLGLCGGLRVLGGSRKLIIERLRQLKARNIRPYDLDTGCTDIPDMLDSALSRIAGAKQLRNDPRQPKRIGRKGGLAKGEAAQAKRNAIMANEIVRRLCEHPKLNWDDRAGILGDGWSASTLRRRYGAH